MNSRGAQQALVPGRMVITLNQRSGLPELGVVCGTPSLPPSALGAAAGLSTKSSTAFGSLQPSTAPSTGPFVCLWSESFLTILLVALLICCVTKVV